MSARALWLISIPLALIAWLAMVLLTAAVPPSWQATAILLPLLLLGVTATLAPLVWVVASRSHVTGTGERPALALRFAAWIGVWTVACVGLALLRVFSWVIAAALGAVLILIETYMLQIWRQQRESKPPRVRRVRAR